VGWNIGYDTPKRQNKGNDYREISSEMRFPLSVLPDTYAQNIHLFFIIDTAI
jgi:hypothetical protein